MAGFYKFLAASLAVLLLALFWMAKTYAAPLLPNDPTAEQNSFYVVSDTNVALCVVGTGLCGPSKLIKGDTTDHLWNNCGLTLSRPPGALSGAQFECRAINAAPPEVKPFVACLPEFSIDLWNTKAKRGDVPPTVSTRWSNYVVWLGKPSCGGKVQGQFYNIVEGGKMLAAAQVLSDTQLNAYIASLPVEVKTPTETAFLKKAADDYAAAIAPPAPTLVVKASTTGLRPYHAPNKAMTGIGAKLGDVAVGTPCDKSKRLGDSIYYWVPSKGGYSYCTAP